MSKKKITFLDWLTEKLFGNSNEKFYKWFFAIVFIYLIIQLIIAFNCFITVEKETVIGDEYVEKIEPRPTDWDFLILALIEVESEGYQFAVGPTNDLGILQITPIYVREVNRLLGDTVYKLEHRTDIDKSLEMFEVYQSHYNPNKNIEKAIKLHNPKAGKWYINKVLTEYNKIKQNYGT